VGSTWRGLPRSLRLKIFDRRDKASIFGNFLLIHFPILQFFDLVIIANHIFDSSKYWAFDARTFNLLAALSNDKTQVYNH
jgi:hypothetical protein